MTRAEERLRDYFGAVADSVRPDNTAPLAPPRLPRRKRRAYGHGDWSGQRGWKAWGVPLVAGASVLAVVSLPAQPLGILDAVAAAPDDRTFYAEMLLADNQAWIFRFRVSGLGSVTGITRIRGGIVHSAYNAGIPRLVVSPDGARLALTTTSSTALSGHGHVIAVQDEIVVINLRAGTQRIWQNGLYRTGTSFDIQSLSWDDSSRSLFFVPAWCSPHVYVLSCPYFVGSNGYSQVRLLNVSGPAQAVHPHLMVVRTAARGL